MYNCAACGKWLKTCEYTNRRTRHPYRIPKELEEHFQCLPAGDYFEVVCEECSKLQWPMIVVSQKASDALMLEPCEACHIVTDLRGTEYTTIMRNEKVYVVRGMRVAEMTYKDNNEAWRNFCFVNEAIKNSRGCNYPE